MQGRCSSGAATNEAVAHECTMHPRSAFFAELHFMHSLTAVVDSHSILHFGAMVGGTLAPL